jgi:hypothetical protein
MEIVKRATSTPFLVKLWGILDENNTAMHWDEDGKTFSVMSTKDVETDILPRYFRSKLFSTFQRQLSYFGFKKQSTQHGKCRWYHDLFQKNAPEKVLLIKRKVNSGNEHKKRKRMAWKLTNAAAQEAKTGGAIGTTRTVGTASAVSVARAAPATKQPPLKKQVKVEQVKVEPVLMPMLALGTAPDPENDLHFTSLYGNTPTAGESASAVDRPTLSMGENPALNRVTKQSRPATRLSPRSERVRVAFSSMSKGKSNNRPPTHNTELTGSLIKDELLEDKRSEVMHQPRRSPRLSHAMFDKDPLLAAMSPLTPANGELMMDWANLAAVEESRKGEIY